MHNLHKTHRSCRLFHLLPTFLLLALTVLAVGGCGSSGSGTPWTWDDRSTAPRASQAPRPLGQPASQGPQKQGTWQRPWPNKQGADSTYINAYPNGDSNTYAPDDRYRPGDQTVYHQGPTSTQHPERAPDLSHIPPAKVAILLPLSGPKAAIGQAMLQAAQLAVFDMGYDNFELIPRDTKGSVQGALEATSSALSEGAQLILGPLFSDSTRAAGTLARRSGVNMISFSTDWTLAGSHTYVMGFLPFAQIQRVVHYTVSQGYQTVGVIAPLDKYGDAVIDSFDTLAVRNGLIVTERLRFAPQESGTLTDALIPFTHYRERQENLQKEITRIEEFLLTSPEDPILLDELDKLKRMETFGDLPFQAVFMPVGGTQAEILANSLSYYGLTPDIVKRLGTGLWDNTTLAREQNLEGGWFAAPSPRIRQNFERRYSDIYGEKPPRLASLAYDSTALAAVLARSGLEKSGRPAFDRRALTNPNGFAGMDGIFRFRANGLVERGLAVLTYKNGKIIELDPAPTSFQTQTLSGAGLRNNRSPAANARFQNTDFPAGQAATLPRP